jgi:hypothetical protein
MSNQFSSPLEAQDRAEERNFPEINLYPKEDWHSKRQHHDREHAKDGGSNNKKKLIKRRRPFGKQSGCEDTDTSVVESIASTLPDVITVSKGFMDMVDKAPDFWTAIKNHKALRYDSIIGYVEGILQLCVILTDENVSTKSAISAVMLYAKTLIKSDKSLIMSIGEYVESLFITPQGGDTTFLDALSECRNNWKLFKDNKLFKKFSCLLTLLVSLGLCEATTLEFSIGSMKLVEARTLNVQMNAFDLTDAIFDTLAFFIEGGYRCYQSGSLKPLLS